MKTEKVLKVLMGMLAVVMLLVVSEVHVFAEGTVSVTADKASAAIGETINVTVQTSEPEDPSVAPEVTVTYNSDVLEYAGADVEIGGGGGLITFSGLSATLTFTARQAGNVNVAAEALIDETTALGSAMVTVGASGGGELSSDATLYVLQMDPGQLVPEFSSDVTEYQIVIGNDVTDITVSGAVSDPAAQITAASGFKNLKEGTNQAVITVTAADGTMLTYHFTIVRGEAEATEEAEEEAEEDTEEETEANTQTGTGLNVTVDGASYVIQSVIPEEILPQGCTKATSTYNGKPVEAALFEKGGLTLLYGLMSGSDEGNFFVYNEATGKLYLFAQIFNIENRYIVPIEAQDAPPAYFKEAQMSWNEFSIPAFALEDKSVENADAFYLLYAVNNEGERGFYLYDTVEGTYQRFLNYSGAKAAPVAASDGGFSKKAVLVIAILIVLLFGAVMLIVNMIIKNKEIQEDTVYEKKTVKKPVVKKEPIKKEPIKKETVKKEEPVEKVKKEPKPVVKKTIVPQPEQAEEVPEEKVQARPVKQAQVQKQEKTVKQVQKQEEPVPKVETAAKKPEPKPEPMIPPIARQRQMMHTDHVVTLQPRHVETVTPVTGEIPVTVVPTPRSEVRRPAVPIFTLEKPSELDDDFEFEFINIDND